MNVRTLVAYEYDDSAQQHHVIPAGVVVSVVRYYPGEKLYATHTIAGEFGLYTYYQVIPER